MWGFIVVFVFVFGPELQSLMIPPVLCMTFEMRGSKDHHQQGNTTQVVAICLKVSKAIADELINVVMVPFERCQWFKKHGLDSHKQGNSIVFPGTNQCWKGVWQIEVWWSWH